VLEHAASTAITAAALTIPTVSLMPRRECPDVAGRPRAGSVSSCFGNCCFSNGDGAWDMVLLQTGVAPKLNCRPIPGLLPAYGLGDKSGQERSSPRLIHDHETTHHSLQAEPAHGNRDDIGDRCRGPSPHD
jgi:hypothetical protein